MGWHILCWVSFSFLQFLSRNAIQAVRGSSRYEEEGEIVAISSVNLYSSCKRQACFQKKLIENKCPKCLIDYSGESSAVSVMCSVAIQQHDEIETKILFTPQVIELLNNEQFSLHSKEEVEKKRHFAGITCQSRIYEKSQKILKHTVLKRIQLLCLIFLCAETIHQLTV